MPATAVWKCSVLTWAAPASASANASISTNSFGLSRLRVHSKLMVPVRAGGGGELLHEVRPAVGVLRPHRMLDHDEDHVSDLSPAFAMTVNSKISRVGGIANTAASLAICC